MEVEKTMKAYPNLSRPIKIGNVTIKNRMFMAPMDTGFGNNSYGGLTQAGVEYFVRRAEGGFGLIFSRRLSCRCCCYLSCCALGRAAFFTLAGAENNAEHCA